MPKLTDFNDNINETLIDLDQKIISTGNKINGWTVGASVAATGPENNAIKWSRAQKIDMGGGKFVDLKNAVRLRVKDHEDYGNIWHAFEAKSGRDHIFTWYDLADYVTNDEAKDKAPLNPEYDVHISTAGKQVHTPHDDQLKHQLYKSEWYGWKKKSLVYRHPANKSDQTLYISFECEKASSYSRGPLVTLINGYLDSEDDSDNPDVSNFRLEGPDPSMLVLDKSHGTSKALGNADWQFSLVQTSDNGLSWRAPDNTQSIRFNLLDGVTADSGDARFWQRDQSKGNSFIKLPARALHAPIPGSDSNSKMIAGLVLAGDFHAIKNVGYYSNGSFTPYNQTPDGAIPLVLKSAAGSDTWTITGTIPNPLTTEQTVTFTLLRNGKASGTQENVSIELDTTAYLTVAPADSVTTETDGTFKLTLTPVSGQTTAHDTTLTLTHGGQDKTFTVTTGAAPVSQYDIKVYDDSDNLIDLDVPHSWADNEQTYVTLAVVKHATGEEVDTAEVKVSVSPEGVVTPSTSSVKFTKGKHTQARVEFSPKSGKSVTITFTALDAKADLKIILGKAAGTLQVVKGNPLLLSPGTPRTSIGENAALDLRFNPPYSGGNPPPISYQVSGHGLHIWDHNIMTVAGDLVPEDPDSTGDYRIQPQLQVDGNPDKTGSIRFYIDPTKHPEAAAMYSEVTVPVSFSQISRVVWSVPDNSRVDVGKTTTLKTKLQAFDNNDKALSAFVLNVNIVSPGKPTASFVSGESKHCVLNGTDLSGWATLPEMLVGEDKGSFTLQASLPDAPTPLPTILTLVAGNPETPHEIVMHPQPDKGKSVEITWNDLDSGRYSKDASRYAQLNLVGGRAAHSGRIRFTLSPNNSAGAKMDTPDDIAIPTVATVDVNTGSGRALWPTIVITKTSGTFTLTAHNEDIVKDVTVGFVVS
jgi:hypothetical protein